MPPPTTTRVAIEGDTIVAHSSRLGTAAGGGEGTSSPNALFAKICAICFKIENSDCGLEVFLFVFTDIFTQTQHCGSSYSALLAAKGVYSTPESCEVRALCSVSCEDHCAVLPCRMQPGVCTSLGLGCSGGWCAAALAPSLVGREPWVGPLEER